jgi:hypothetical protein
VTRNTGKASNGCIDIKVPDIAMAKMDSSIFYFFEQDSSSLEWTDWEGGRKDGRGGWCGGAARRQEPPATRAVDNRM